MNTFSIIILPTEEQITNHRPGLDALRKLRETLPWVDVVHDYMGNILDENSGDYPNLASSECTKNWFTEFNRRSIFCIDGVPYFRRYNDDWNSLTMKGEIVGNRVEWLSPGITPSDLVSLAD